MIDPEKFLMESARETADYRISCRADPRMFAENWDDIPKEIQEIFDGNFTIPCEGSGLPGMFCWDCIYSEIEELT